MNGEQGHPRQFPTELDFKNKFKEYIKYCDDKHRLANIAGFAVYCDMCRDTFYAQKDYYPNTFSKIQDILEDYTINSDTRDILKIFYLKCKFDYKDGREIDPRSVGRINIIDDLPNGDDNE